LISPFVEPAEAARNSAHRSTGASSFTGVAGNRATDYSERGAAGGTF
jgi:hypothetical protein